MTERMVTAVSRSWSAGLAHGATPGDSSGRLLQEKGSDVTMKGSRPEPGTGPGWPRLFCSGTLPADGSGSRRLVLSPGRGSVCGGSSGLWVMFQLRAATG